MYASTLYLRMAHEQQTYKNEYASQTEGMTLEVCAASSASLRL